MTDQTPSDAAQPSYCMISYKKNTRPTRPHTHAHPSGTHTHTHQHLQLRRSTQNDYAEDDTDDFDLNFVPDLPQLGAQYRRAPTTSINIIIDDDDDDDDVERPPSAGTSIADVHVEPFSAAVARRTRPRQGATQLLQPPAGDVLMLITDNPNQRQFRNPVSYLGGPLLEPRNRKSLDSMLSVD